MPAKNEPALDQILELPNSVVGGPARVAELKPLLVSMRDLGKLCGIGKTGCFELLKSGQLRSCLMGRKRLVYYADVERLVAKALESGRL